MKIKITLLLWTACLFLAAGAASAARSEDAVRFEKANRYYREGKFQEALSIYNELAEKYPDSAPFFYNLGNSYHRTKNPGAAILAYERALLASPRDRDIRYNLNYVRGLLEYRIEDKRNWYLGAAEKALGYFREKEVAFLASGTFLLFAGSWAFALFFRRNFGWGNIRKTLLIFFAFFLVLWAAKKVQTHLIGEAVVMVRDAQVRYGPSETDQIAFRLGEGLKVYVLDHREDWSRVLLTNGESGWMKDTDIAKIHIGKG